ncbi:hypothetical protein [Streptomyces sp. NPDC093225]|uniref:hypothetical protein n=1 Tax=Streptomyces sp. NPDC093225 TaxID=3366034 RepID=UPI00381C04FE
MPRLLRYLIIWLTCTAASVAAVTLAARFVVGSTRPTAPVAQSAQEDISADSAATPSGTPAGPSATPTPDPGPTARPAAVRTPPRATRTPRRTAAPERSTAPSAKPDPDCARGGWGTHTVPSEGGRATVRYGSKAVCLISAVPQQGFSVSTRQSSAQTLVVTFTSGTHRSEITATVTPSARASVREESVR